MTATAGRNDPCPCGSGRKYKKCCGNAQATAANPSAPDLPTSAEAHNELGNALQGLNRREEAVASYRRALDLNPRLAAAHSNMGAALHSLGRVDQAVTSYRRALEIMPTLPETHNNLGNALRSLGQLDEAERSYLRALEIRPRYFEAHNNLGNALRRLGRLDAAVSSFRRALEIMPSAPEPYNNLGNTLRDLKQIEAAVSSYRRALELKPDFAEVHSNLGATLLESGDLPGAVASLERASELTPGNAERHNDLGNALRKVDRPDDAVASYRRALEIKPDFAAAHGNLAAVLRLQGLLAQSEASCRAALALDPQLAPAIALLADFHADQGEFGEAERLFRRAIALEPDYPQAWAGLALLRTFTQADAAWAGEVQRILGQELRPEGQVHLRYALGKYFDDLGDFKAAFRHYRRANELEKLRKHRHDRSLLKEAVGQLIERYDHAWLERARSAGNPSERPVLIVGMPRSGTTLAEQILASHPAVHGAGELTFWESAMATLESSGTQMQAGAGLIREFSQDYLRLLEEKSPAALRVVDKMPGNFLFLGLIHAALPHARIINMQRAALDTCLSIYFQNFETSPAYTNDLDDLADYYAQYLRLMNHWRTTLPAATILEVPYEGLVENQETWTRKMLAFVGLPWDARCLDFSRTVRTVITASKWQVRQRVSNKSVGRWRNYADFIGPLHKLID